MSLDQTHRIEHRVHLDRTHRMSLDQTHRIEHRMHLDRTHRMNLDHTHRKECRVSLDQAHKIEHRMSGLNADNKFWKELTVRVMMMS